MIISGNSFRVVIFFVQKKIHSLPVMLCSLLGSSCRVALCPVVMEGLSLGRSRLVGTWDRHTLVWAVGRLELPSSPAGLSPFLTETKLLLHPRCCWSVGD